MGLQWNGFGNNEYEDDTWWYTSTYLTRVLLFDRKLGDFEGFVDFGDFWPPDLWLFGLFDAPWVTVLTAKFLCNLVVARGSIMRLHICIFQKTGIIYIPSAMISSKRALKRENCRPPASVSPHPASLREHSTRILHCSWALKNIGKSTNIWNSASVFPHPAS